MINPPKLRQKIARGKKQGTTLEVEYGPRQKWAVDLDTDNDTRAVCEGT